MGSLVSGVVRVRTVEVPRFTYFIYSAHLCRGARNSGTRGCDVLKSGRRGARYWNPPSVP